MSRYLQSKEELLTGSNPMMVSSENLSSKYEVLEELGRGMHATVFRGKNLSTGDFHALKMTKKTRLRSKREEHNRALINEASILKNLNHKNIIKCIEAFEHSAQIIVVLELVQGGELFQYLFANKAISEDECRFFAREVLNGLCYLHENSVVHLDLKPENIMLKNLQSKELVIVDFSLSKLIKPSDKIKVMAGTVEFSAPEIFNYEYIGLSTDMWSFGVILYILLSGFSPFLGETDAETQTNICQVDIPFDIEEFKIVSILAIDLVKSLLVKDMKKRFTCAQCLKHEWFYQKNSSPRYRSDTFSGIVTQGLKKFISKNAWRKIHEKVQAFTSYAKNGEEGTRRMATPSVVYGAPVLTRSRSI